MRLKKPAQPLVFCFPNVSALCGAASELCGLYPGVKARLSLYREKYFLAVYSSLGQRASVVRALGEYGLFLGPGRVLYSFYEEHGRLLSRDAVKELGGPLRRAGEKRGEA